mgnify:FL=1|jgi:hypothetical protein|tara:strand:- start:2648 stop:2956 length:309 start_codon:yes stop_codon:yes gene_type:complete
MIKALMVITMVSGADYTAKMDSMEVCLEQVKPVVTQAGVESVTCVPRTDRNIQNDMKMTKFFELFRDMVKEAQLLAKLAEEEARPSPYCFDKSIWGPGYNEC